MEIQAGLCGDHLVAGIAIVVTLQGVEETDFGYHVIDLGAQVPMTLFVFGLTLSVAFNLARTYRSVSMGEIRWQSLLMATAIVFLFSYTLLVDACRHIRYTSLCSWLLAI